MPAIQNLSLLQWAIVAGFLALVLLLSAIKSLNPSVKLFDVFVMAVMVSLVVFEGKMMLPLTALIAFFLTFLFIMLCDRRLRAQDKESQTRNNP